MTMAAPAAPAASGSPSAGGRPAPGRRRPGEFGSGRKFTPRRKVCQFCVDKIKEVDYKDLVRLRRFLSERGKIEPRRKTGTCAAHQRSLNVALKRARQLALLPFTAEHIRVTGVLVREPGAPPFRGARPRPQETEAPAPAPAPAAEVPADGAATPADGTATPTPTQAETEAEAAPSDGQVAPAVPAAEPASTDAEARAAPEAASETPAPAAAQPA